MQQILRQKEIGEDVTSFQEEFINILADENVEIASVNNRETNDAKKMFNAKIIFFKGQDEILRTNSAQNQVEGARYAYESILRKLIDDILKELDWGDRHEWLNYMKTKANNLFRDHQYEQAIQIYMETSIGLDFTSQDKEVRNPIFQIFLQKNELIKLQFQIPILTNLAMCYKRKKEFEKSLKFFTMAVQMDPENPVQILRRAYTYFEAGQQQNAIKDLKECERLFEICPDNSLLQDMKVLAQKIQDEQENYSKACKKMFPQRNTNENGHNNQDPKEEEKQKLIGKDMEDAESIGRIQRFGQLILSLTNLIKQIFGCKRIFLDEDDSEVQSPEEFIKDLNNDEFEYIQPRQNQFIL